MNAPRIAVGVGPIGYICQAAGAEPASEAQAPGAALRTPAEAHQWLDYHGISVSQFAREHGFSRAIVYELLAGRKRGLRGQAHNIAVALGMKRGVATTRPGRVTREANQKKNAGAPA